MTHRYTILHGGNVLTMGSEPAAEPRATAIAYAAGRILAAGTDEAILPLAGPDSHLLDLGGATIVPGFHDPHAHPLLEGLQAGWLDLVATPDVRGALRVLSDSSARLEFDAWLEARFDEQVWRERRLPTRDELDRAVPDHPVLLVHRSGQVAIANSLALALAGIGAGSEDRVGLSELRRDEHGEPTGEIRGQEPVAPFAAALPPLTAEAARAALAVAGRRLAEAGVTWVGEGDLGLVAAPVDEIAAYAGAVIDGALPMRLGLLPGLARLARADEDPPTPEDVGALIPAEARERMTVWGGALAAAGSAGDEAQRERIGRSIRAGWRLAVQPFDEEMLDATLTAIRTAVAVGPGPGVRHRIDLPTAISDRDLAFIVELAMGTVLSAAEPGIGGPDSRLRPLVEAGVPAALGSDRPRTDSSPLVTLRAASDAESAASLLGAWTSGGARIDCDDGESGVLAAGYRADLVVLSNDPLAAARGSGSPEVELLATVADGRPIFDSIGLPAVD